MKKRKKQLRVPAAKTTGNWIVTSALPGGDSIGGLLLGEGYVLSLYNRWNRDPSEPKKVIP